MKANLVDCKCFFCGDDYRKRLDRVRYPDFCGLECRMSFTAKNNRDNLGRDCLKCGSFFTPRLNQVKNNQGVYCSNSCALKGCIIPAAHTVEANKKRAESFRKSDYFKNPPSGPDHRDYKEVHIRGGYRWVDDDNGVKIQEHRLVMEAHIGRKLLTEEIVHHKNEDKLDNGIDNLEIMSRSEHARHHMSKSGIDGQFLPTNTTR